MVGQRVLQMLVRRWVALSKQANCVGMNGPGLNGPGLNSPGSNGPGMNGPGLNDPGLNGTGALMSPTSVTSGSNAQVWTGRPIPLLITSSLP